MVVRVSVVDLSKLRAPGAWLEAANSLFLRFKWHAVYVGDVFVVLGVDRGR